MPEKFYQSRLYPFQDNILKSIESLGVDFYLTGGTALGRFYLSHRYSDDLDFFVNDHPKFKYQCNRVVDFFKKSDWHCDVSTASDSFVRVFLEDGDLIIKIDFINDVPFHYGEFVNSHVFHKIDNWRNILSNKLCALTRIEPKDIADIIFIAKKYSFEWEDIIKEAKEKDLWVEPLEICKTINNFPIRLLIDIKWVNEIDMDEMNDCIKTIHDDIFYGNFNSLK